MNDKTQYGRPVLLNGFGSDATAQPLQRVPFVKRHTETNLYDELWLQKLIMQHPSLLPVDQIEPALMTMQPVCIELPVGSKFLDNLFVTPQGDLALVECKLWRNPEARREVIAQIIEYAHTMSGWSSDELESAVRRAKPAGGVTLDRPLVDIVARDEDIDSTLFYDALSRNLRRGRFLLLIVGDGIREGVESMAAFLQQYAGFHFTLALVELSVFLLDGGKYILQPRVLAKTTNIDRGIVTIDGRGTIQIVPPAVSLGGSPRTTITEERYFEQIETRLPGVTNSLSAFLAELGEVGVAAEYGADSLILRWRPDDGRSWNFASISSRGNVVFEILGQQAQSAALLDAFKRYLEMVADAAMATVRETPKVTGWYVTPGKGYITVDTLVNSPEHRAGWISAISTFQTAASALAGA